MDQEMNNLGERYLRAVKEQPGTTSVKGCARQIWIRVLISAKPVVKHDGIARPQQPP